jgi:hypothetical protein
MFVALMTPDDAVEGGKHRARQNVVDELRRAKERPHLRQKILVFKHADVETYSNLNPTYEALDLDDLGTVPH